MRYHVVVLFKRRGGGEGASIFARENPFAIIYRRVLYLAGKVKTMGDNLGAPFSKKNVFEEENWTGMICFRKLITTIPPPPPEFPGVYKMRDSICF